MAVGVAFTCALLDDAQVKCFGSNDDGALGGHDGTTMGDELPRAQPGVLDNAPHFAEVQNGVDDRQGPKYSKYSLPEVPKGPKTKKIEISLRSGTKKEHKP